MLNKLFQFLKNKHYQDKEMVSYWKTKDSVMAKVTLAKEGHNVMWMEGEKYPFPGFPRGVLLYGGLSKLKHNVKNLVFNDIWAMLENRRGITSCVKHLKEVALPQIFEILESQKYDMVPPHKMVPVVKEIWRALTIVEEKMGSERIKKCKEVLTFVLQEDDAYRFRFQWAMKFMRYKFFRRNYVKLFDFALSMLEHGEMVGDMKERQRLFRRGMMTLLKDPHIKECFDMFMKEVDWKKLRLTKADKYFFRAKYFKVDYPEYKY